LVFGEVSTIKKGFRRKEMLNLIASLLIVVILVGSYGIAWIRLEYMQKMYPKRYANREEAQELYFYGTLLACVVAIIMAIGNAWSEFA
jgi:hypothetical protein